MNTLTTLFSNLARIKSILAGALALTVTMLASNGLQALGLGTIHVDSIFGQPFVGSIEVFNAEGYDENSVTVRLASREVHEQLGISQPPYIEGLDVKIVFNELGNAEVLVRGQAPIREPYIEFVLDMRWTEGQVVRDYTVLLDMPSTTVPLRQDVSTATQSSEPKAQSSYPIPHSSLYTAEWGDSLSLIAERLEGREVAVAEATETLRAHNAHLFGSNSSSSIKVGDRLRIPAKEVFSQPSTPVQPVVDDKPEEKPIAEKELISSSVASQSATESIDDSKAGDSVGSPLANAETRLRALGYTNLQLQANGETPNPVVASGAAANILERLIAEQSEADQSYGTAQIGRLAEGLNEVSSISRAYQQRLSALEEATKANADALATLIDQNEQAQPVAASEPVVTAPALDSESVSVPLLSNEISNSSASETSERSGFSQIMRWLIWLPVLLAALCGIWALRQRNKDNYAYDLPLSETASAEQESAENQQAPTQTLYAPQTEQDSDVVETADSEHETAPTADDSEESPEHKMEPSAAENAAASASSSSVSNIMPFYDEATLDHEEPAGAHAEILDGDLDSELDEELKLISIFEENLASETAVRTQMKSEEEEPVELISRPEEEDEEPSIFEENLASETVVRTQMKPEEDILDFNLESLETKDELEFVLEESELNSPDLFEAPAIDEVAESTQAAELSNESQSEAETTLVAVEKPEQEKQAAAAPLAETQNYSGYADSGFSHINPVEVVEIVNQKLLAAKNAGKETTLFYIEIDGFSELESDLGLMRAEKLAANVASNIYDRIENPVTLKRFRQESFVLLLAGGQNQQNLQFGEELARAIASTPIDASNETFFVTLSIGIVPVASGFANSAEIIEMARDVVLKYREENDGNGATLCELDPDTAHNEASIMRSGRKLLNNDAFVAVYQPVTALKGDPLEFYEARLKIAEDHEDKSFPTDLIDRLGNTDLSTEIDCVTVNQALSELNDYLNSHVSTRIFIGISARTATDNFFKNWFEKTLFSEGIHPERIVLQMSEQSVSRHLNGLIEFRDYAHNLGARICISGVNFEHVPEHALARLHPDFVQLSTNLSSDAQHEGDSEKDKEKQRQGLERLTEVLEKAKPLCEKIIVPGVSQARIIPTLWPLSVDYIQGDYIKPESLMMDYDFEEVVS